MIYQCKVGMILDTALLACKTLECELRNVIAATGCTYPVYWIDSGLHNYPISLQSCIKQQLDAMTSYERIIIVFGVCGGVLNGIKTGAHTLVMPRVDDCISLLLGSLEERRRFKDAYFLTYGWLGGERTIYDEYIYTSQKYGQAMADEFSKAIFNGYKRVIMIDSDSYNVERSIEMAKPLAKQFNLKIDILHVDLHYLTDLVTGPWDERRFVIYKPGTVIEQYAC